MKYGPHPSLIFDQTSTRTLSQSNKLLPIIYGEKKFKWCARPINCVRPHNIFKYMSYKLSINTLSDYIHRGCERRGKSERERRDRERERAKWGRRRQKERKKDSRRGSGSFEKIIYCFFSLDKFESPACWYLLVALLFFCRCCCFFMIPLVGRGQNDNLILFGFVCEIWTTFKFIKI